VSVSKSARAEDQLHDYAIEIGATDWQPPQPIQAALRPVAPFDSDTLLPDGLRDFVMDEASRMPCSPDFIAVGVMVAIGAVIGAR
jgi:hypothetical protein